MIRLGTGDKFWVLSCPNMNDVDSLDTGGGNGELRYQWHDAVHYRWASEELWFTFIGGVTAFDRDRILESLDDIFESQHINAFAVYPVLGGRYDLVIRAWLSGGIDDLHAAVRGAFGGSVFVESSKVDRIVRHWIWGEDGAPEARAPDESVLAEPLDRLTIHSFNHKSISQELLDELAAKNLVSESIHTTGIKFLMVLNESHLPMTEEMRAWTTRSISEILDSATHIHEKSLYRLDRLGSYLILGRIEREHFYKLDKELLTPIHLGPGSQMTASTRTYLTFHEDLLAFQDALVLPQHIAAAASAESLLERQEGRFVEVKGSATVSLDPWLFTPEKFPKPPRDDSVVQQLLSEIAAFLNTDGGTIMVGAIERDSAKYAGLEGLPGRGRFWLTGIDHDLGVGGWDQFERRLIDLVKRRIKGPCADLVDIDLDEAVAEDGKVVPMAVITVRAPSRRERGFGRWFYLYENTDQPGKFFARFGSESQQIDGLDADQYRKHRS